MAINWQARRDRTHEWAVSYTVEQARKDARNLELGKGSREEALRRIRHYERSGY